MNTTDQANSDSERLVFMLENCRKIVTENCGSNGRGDTFYQVYVEEGTMCDRKYPAVHITGNINTAMDLASKRAAIDLAIIEVRGESSE